MNISAKKIIAIALGALVAVAPVAGCASQDGDAGSGSAPTAQETSQAAATDPVALSELMGKLEDALTVEEANELIGSEGEKGDDRTYDGGSYIAVTTDYSWDIGDDKSITGAFRVYEGGGGDDYTTYETNYNYKRVKDYASFSNWDEIEKRLKSSEGLTYDGLVELLGGVQGLKTKVSTTGEITYHWYDADGGYLWSSVDAAGKCGSTSAWF